MPPPRQSHFARRAFRAHRPIEPPAAVEFFVPVELRLDPVRLGMRAQLAQPACMIALAVELELARQAAAAGVGPGGPFGA
jgi:hypothetical protein